jgi:hypothetical protein
VQEQTRRYLDRMTLVDTLNIADHHVFVRRID